MTLRLLSAWWALTGRKALRGIELESCISCGRCIPVPRGAALLCAGCWRLHWSGVDVWARRTPSDEGRTP